jgi:hypothetical protein
MTEGKKPSARIPSKIAKTPVDRKMPGLPKSMTMIVIRPVAPKPQPQMKPVKYW